MVKQSLQKDNNIEEQQHYPVSVNFHRDSVKLKWFCKDTLFVEITIIRRLVIYKAVIYKKIVEGSESLDKPKVFPKLVNEFKSKVNESHKTYRRN